MGVGRRPHEGSKGVCGRCDNLETPDAHESRRTHPPHLRRLTSAAPGEGWAPGVRKLAAVHDGEGFLGNVYLDLYQRASGKFPGAAHFTLRCGRRLPDGSYQVGAGGAPCGCGHC